jgi:hypothetical protein
VHVRISVRHNSDTASWLAELLLQRLHSSMQLAAGHLLRLVLLHNLSKLSPCLLQLLMQAHHLLSGVPHARLAAR